MYLIRFVLQKFVQQDFSQIIIISGIGLVFFNIFINYIKFLFINCTILCHFEQPYEINFSRQLSGWVFGNIIFGGFIGLAVDAVSGGIYMLTPDQVQAELRGNSMAHSKNYKDSFITIVLEPNPSWKKIGNLVAAN